MGRWASIDPLHFAATGWTPYRFGFNDPIRYSDSNGEFEIDKATAKKYPKFTAYLKRLYDIYQQKPEQFKNAFKKWSEMSDVEIKQVLTFNSGPKIVVETPPIEEKKGGVYFGQTIIPFGRDKNDNVVPMNANEGKGLIYIRPSVVEAIEKSYISEAMRDVSEMMLEIVVFHEAVHFGDVKHQPATEHIEVGFQFEKDAYGLAVDEYSDIYVLLRGKYSGDEVNRQILQQIESDNEKKAHETLFRPDHTQYQSTVPIHK